MNQALTQKWSQLRGLVIVSVAMNPITLPEEDAQMIKEAQRMAILRNPAMAAATLAGAQADAMKTAAGNAGGAMTGFMGMNMAGMTGGFNAQNLYAMGQQQAAQAQQMAHGNQIGGLFGGHDPCHSRHTQHIPLLHVTGFHLCIAFF